MEKYYSITDFEEERRLARIDELEEILSQSTPLITELEKAFDAGSEWGYDTLSNNNKDSEIFENKKEYISNLKK